MTEYGFAIGVSKSELLADEEATLNKVRRLLRFNYRQFVNFVMERDGSVPFAEEPVYMVGPPWEYFEEDLITHAGEEPQVPYAWYVNTDPDYTPAEHHELLEGAIDG